MLYPYHIKSLILRKRTGGFGWIFVKMPETYYSSILDKKFALCKSFPQMACFALYSLAYYIVWI